MPYEIIYELNLYTDGMENVVPLVFQASAIKALASLSNITSSKEKDTIFHIILSNQINYNVDDDFSRIKNNIEPSKKPIIVDIVEINNN